MQYSIWSAILKQQLVFSQTAKEFSIKFKSFKYGTLIWSFS